MKKRRCAGLIIAVVMMLVLAGCKATKETTPETTNGSVNETVTEEVTEPAAVSTETGDTSAESEPTLAEAGSDDLETIKGFGLLSLAQDIGPDGSAVFAVCDAIIGENEDELEYAEDNPQMLLAFEDCVIQIVDPEKDVVEYRTVTLAEFCDYLRNSRDTIAVIYEKDDLDTLTLIQEDIAG